MARPLNKATMAALAVVLLAVPAGLAAVSPVPAGFPHGMGGGGGSGAPEMVAGPLRLTFDHGAVQFATDDPTPGAAGASFQVTFENARAGQGAPSAYGAGGDEVLYAALWEGVDLAYRATALGPKYELRLAPDAALEAVEFRVERADSLRVNEGGALQTTAGLASVTDSAPTSWDDAGRAVSCGYELRGEFRYGFVCDGWDRAHGLTIDPLMLSTFLGGSQRDEAQAVALDNQGNIIVVGWTSSVDFPVTAFSPDQDPAGGDAFVAKFSPDGTQLLFATYLGGSGFEVAFAVVTDAAGRIWVVGQTNSGDLATTPDAAQPNASGGMDAFAARLSADGTAVEYLTYLGGAGWDRALGLALDRSGEPVVTGETNSTGFPTTTGPPLNNASGYNDAFVARYNVTSGALNTSWLIGGDGSDSGRAVAVDTDGDLILAGSTNSTDLPVINAWGSPYDATYNGGFDAFVAALYPANATTSVLTYFGGSGDDFAYALDLDALGNPVVGGLTGSSDFPATAGVLQPGSGGLEDGFLAKFTTNAGALTYSTFLGGDASEGVVGLTVAPDGTTTIVGFTDSLNFPVTPGAFRTVLSGTALTSRVDAFFARIAADASQSLYASYIGEGGVDIARGVQIDGQGLAVVVGATDAGGFPTTVGAVDRVLNSTEAFMFRAWQRRPVLSIATDPPGRTYTINGTPFSSAYSAPCSEGVILPILVTSPQPVSGYRYVYTNWSDGESQNRTAPCQEDQTIEVRFRTEVFAVVSTNPSGLFLMVDGLNVTSPLTFWWPFGSTHSVEALTLLALNGTRYLFDGWVDGGPAERTVTANGPINLQARFTADAYLLDLATDPPGLVLAVDGVNFTCPTMIWLTIGSAHTIAAPSPQPATPGVRLAFANWSDAAPAARVYTASARGSLLAAFATEFEIRLDSVPSGLSVAIDGIETATPWSQWRGNGTGISLAPPSSAPDIGGVQYGAMSWSDAGASVRSWTVWRPEALVAIFQPVAYELRLESSPAGVPLTLEGTADGAARSFQPSGATVSVGAPASFTNGSTRFTFLRWSDVGNRSHYATITAPVTLIAFFSREFEVRIAAIPGDSRFRIDGIEHEGTATVWMEEGSVHQLTAPEVVPAGAGRRLAWQAWGDGEAATHAFMATGPALLNLTYAVEVFLTVETASGDPTCDIPTCWYPVGAVAVVTVKSPWNESGGKREVLLGWLGNSSAQDNSATARMDGPGALTVLWKAQFFLSVTTRFGTATGAGWYDEGAPASFRISAAEVSAGGTRYRFTAWSGDLVGQGEEGFVYMDGPKSVVAVWEEVRAPVVEGPLWLLMPLIAAAAAALAVVVVRRRKAAAQLQRAWKSADEFEPVEPTDKR